MSNALLLVGAVLFSGMVLASAQDLPEKPKNDSPSAAATPGSSAVAYFDKDKVAQAQATGAALYKGAEYRVQMGRRTEPGQTEVHTKDTDIFYIVEGSATFVTGGTVVEGKTTAPGEIRGTAINGGEAHTLKKGDVIVIPANVPHWFKQIQEPLSYFVVKVQ